jgi:hypothetical protein
MPSQTFFSAPEPAIFPNYHLLLVMSIPPSIHDLHLRYLEINDSLFSSEKRICTSLQQHHEHFESVPNSLQMSSRKHLLILPSSPFRSQTLRSSGLLNISRSLRTRSPLKASPCLRQVFDRNSQFPSVMVFVVIGISYKSDVLMVEGNINAD